MSAEKKYSRPDWECADAHLPQWIKDLDNALSACMSDEEMSRAIIILTEYNELTDREESNEEDGFSIYGIETRKEEIINELIAICEKHREEATKISNWLNETENNL